MAVGSPTDVSQLSPTADSGKRVPTAALGARVGVSERVDVGLRLGLGPVAIDGKYNFYRSKWLDLAADLGVGFSATYIGGSSSEARPSPPAPYYVFPSANLLAGINLGDTVTLVPSVGLTELYVFGGPQDQWLTSLRSGLGVRLAFPDANVSLQPEITMARPLSNDGGVVLAGGLTATWGKIP
jgi:hypothetical protein